MRLYSVILITIVALFGVSCRDSETPKATSLGTFNMGEKAQVGPVTYTVFDSKWELSLGEQPTPRIPTNRFFILNISAVNTAGTTVSIPTFSLVDDNGQVYPELDNGEGVKKTKRNIPEAHEEHEGREDGFQILSETPKPVSEVLRRAGSCGE